MTTDRLRIGISGLPLGNLGGTGYYTEQLLRVLFERARAHFDITVLGSSIPDNIRTFNTVREASKAVLRWPLSAFANRVSEEAISGLDLLHFPNCVGPPQTRTPLVVTLHDVSPFLHRETFSIHTAAYLRWVFSANVRVAKTVITDSHWQAERVLEVWPEIGNKLRVVYPTLSPAFHTPPSDSPNRFERPYLLMVGTLEPRKRCDLAIEAWRESDADVDLVLVGRWGWKSEALKRLLSQLTPETRTPPGETTFRISGGRSLRHIESAATPLLVDLYRNAIGLVYPSLFEGFGLPVLEAMALGCPVLTRKGSAMEEIAGSAGWYFESDSVEELATLFESFLGKPDLRNGRATVGREIAKNYSDERFCEGIVSAYESVLSQ